MATSCERTVIFGPPGTGKTTRLIEEVERELEAGTDPERIAYVSFTRSAVETARERARERFGLAQKRFPWFRTLHSLAFRMLGVQRDAMLQRPDYWGMGLKLSRSLEDAAVGLTADDRLLAAHNLVRATGRTIEQLKLERELQVAVADWYAFERRLAEWKKKEDKWEFADLLDEYLRRGGICPVDVAVIDEAQDLTAIQWRCVERAFADCRRIIIAGDDDQTIFEWAGAEAAALLQTEGEHVVLNQSHRVPEPVRRYANRIITRVAQRKDKAWLGTGFAGTVSRVQHLAEVTFKHNSESYLLLARHQCFVRDMSRWLSQQGIMHLVNGELSVPPVVLAARAQLRRILGGARIPVHQCRELLMLSPGRVRQRLGDVVGGEQLETLRPLGKCKPELLEFESAAWRRWGEAIPQQPLVRLMTIHAAKGAEADNVIVTPSQLRAPAEALRGADAEARLFYVAATRARHRLAILAQPTPFRYDMPM